MAQSSKQSSRAAQPKKPRTPLSRGLRRTLLLAVAGIAVLLIVAAGVWFLWTRTGREEAGGRLTVSKDFGPGAPQGAPTGPGGARPGAERSHTVKPGENLWDIASHGDLVASAWEWRTILVQNRDKIQYAFVSEEDGGWKVMVENGQQLTVKTDGSPGYPGAAAPSGKLYAVQVLTVPDRRLGRAVGIVRRLLADGHFAYLYRHEADGKRFYRIRVGFYASPEDAMRAGEDIVAKYQPQKLFKDYWVTRPSDVELQGGQMDYGVQETRPWVVELPERGSHHEALEDLRKIAAASDFAYIAQKRAGSARSERLHGEPEESAVRYVYRTRIGFFASESQARAFIAAHKGSAAVLEQGAPVRLDNFQEALPGQNLRLSKPAQG
jgi:hypothetical protein